MIREHVLLTLIQFMIREHVLLTLIQFMIREHVLLILIQFMIREHVLLILISGFHCDVAETCALLGYYVASCGNCLPAFRDNISVPSSRVKSPIRKGFLTPEDGTDTLSQNVSKQLPHNAV
jgi:hypothetical protein